MRICPDMNLFGLLVDPQPEPGSLRDAGDDDTGTCCGHQHRVRVFRRHPPASEPEKFSGGHRALQARAAHSLFLQALRTHDTSQLDHEFDRVRGSRMQHPAILH